MRADFENGSSFLMTTSAIDWTHMQQHSSNHRRYTRRRFLILGLTGLAGAMVGGCGPGAGQGEVSNEVDVSPTPLPPAAPQPPTLPAVAPAPDAASPAATVEMETPSAAATATPATSAGATDEAAAGATGDASVAAAGVLRARPGGAAAAAEAPPGVQPLGLRPERDALVYIPAGYTPNKPATLVLLLHGAGGVAEHGLSLLQDLADANNLLLLATASERQTWDMIRAEYGPDVAHVDQALAHVFSRYAVDPTRLAVGGFSDGASYALSLGVINGDLFTHIIAFSPGYMAPTRQAGKPRIFISHGTRDEVLPIDRTSRQIVPRLEQARYDVRYREFDGPHTVPPEMAQDALIWLMAPPG